MRPKKNEVKSQIQNEQCLELVRKVYNSKLWLKVQRHHCWKTDGTRCHVNDEAVRADACKANAALLSLIFDPSKSPSDKDWFRFFLELVC